jgi:hypothetical protein
MKDEWTITFNEAMDRMTKKASLDLQEQNPLIQLMTQYYNSQPEEEVAMLTSVWAKELLTNPSEDIHKSFLIKQISAKEQRGLGKEFRKIQPLLRKLGFSFEIKNIAKGTQWTLSHSEKHSINSINSIDRDGTPPSDNGMNGMNGNNIDLFNQQTGNHKTHDDF